MHRMILEYITAALEHARYEIIEDDEPYYGEVPELPGVWATRKTLEECRRNLAGVIDEWLIVRLRRGLPIPRLPAAPWERAPGWIPVPEHRIRPASRDRQKLRGPCRVCRSEGEELNPSFVQSSSPSFPLPGLQRDNAATIGIFMVYVAGYPPHIE
ncbi:MAG: type II toxin-antitoxin system HicB family antitoxin [Methanoculleus sp.]|uniref:type II toxin-antitoxin system HicB family antitoxin n=2 Tax=Methanoculleus sp. TaxID=90427 RepID=UPI002625E0D7|nr:type II toxin-antitoxin system HicB family antitoxin [Methanoculleus sp.]MDD4314477.1 type II toxin-antitoxin system HicB family antitoxin [Methanoculleus sp.]MDD4472133.1 type II toxin-antitoxin system HicB family antitoxin [Methanoculleus sp.]